MHVSQQLLIKQNPAWYIYYIKKPSHVTSRSLNYLQVLYLKEYNIIHIYRLSTIIWKTPHHFLVIRSIHHIKLYSIYCMTFEYLLSTCARFVLSNPPLLIISLFFWVQRSTQYCINYASWVLFTYFNGKISVWYP